MRGGFPKFEVGGALNMSEGLGNLRYPKGRGLSKGNGKGGKIGGGSQTGRGCQKLGWGAPKFEGGGPQNLRGGLSTRWGT